jgi:ABC-type sugar transport system permease subunit
VLFAVPLSVIPALILSNILNSKLPGMKFFRAVYFMPSIAAVVGIALVWQWLYNATIGYINYFITFGIEFWNNLSTLRWQTRRSSGYPMNRLPCSRSSSSPPGRRWASIRSLPGGLAEHPR